MSTDKYIGPTYSKVISKKNAKSQIWNYFGLPADEKGTLIQENFSVCKICKSHVASKGGQTTNMIKHLHLHHPLQYTEYSKTKSPLPCSSRSCDVVDDPCDVVDDPNCPSSIETVQCGKKPLAPLQKTLFDFQPMNSTSTTCINESLAKFLAFTMLPYNLVESKPFVNLIKLLNPRYKVPSRKYFSTVAIPKLYNDSVEKMKRQMSTVEIEEISLTTDCWTSVANMPYIAVTVHFVDQQWNMKSFCLSCVQFEENHNYENICNTLTSILLDWRLDIKKVACFTTDNGSNIVKAMSHLQLKHITCFGHNINIGINRALEITELRKAVSRLKKLQSAISHSWKMKRDLSNAQSRLDMKVVALPSACPTRWWSILKLIRRFLDNQVPICLMIQNYMEKKDLIPEGNEVNTLQTFVENTKMLEDMTKTLSGDDYVTASSVMPLYREIKKNLQHEESDSALANLIKAKILSALSERYEDESFTNILWVSSFCDPRFRLNYTDNADEIKDLVLEKLRSIHRSISPRTDQPAAEPGKVKKGLAKFLKKDVKTLDMLPEDKALKELNEYVGLPEVELEANPLLWWKTHAASFPALKTLARKYLAIQGTSVSSERVFSTGGNVVTRQRAALLPKNVDMLVFLAQNSKST